jgi:hypothetical protein
LVGVALVSFLYLAGLRQTGTAFLGIFVICLVTLMPINWVLYDKIYQDLDWM